MKKLTEVLEVELENAKYRDALYLVKLEIQRIRSEYLLGAISLAETAIDEVDEELNTVIMTIENIIY